MNAGGGLVFILLFVVVPAAFVGHLGCRRFLTVSLVISACFTMFLAILWLVFDVLDHTSGDRMWASLPIIPVGFVASLITCLNVGLPITVARWWSRRR